LCAGISATDSARAFAFTPGTPRSQTWSEASCVAVRPATASLGCGPNRSGVRITGGFELLGVGQQHVSFAANQGRVLLW
jgi:hypothetical protein